MKKTITLASLLISTISFAQLPTITATNQIPAIDDSIHYSDANTFGFDPNGSGGAIDVIWDYSTLTPVGPVDFWYVDPATTAEAANFSSSNIAQANSIGTGFEYFETTASSISRWGYAAPGGSIYYSPSFVRYSFPITPGVIQSQTYSGTMTSLGAGEDSVTIANGNYQANPDAYGTLSLPPLVFGGQPEVFDSVIRVHVTEQFQIVAWLFGTPAITINVSDDYYFFFDEETQEPILIYGVTTDDGGGTPQTVLRYQNTIAGTSTGGSGAGINELENASIGVYPNPTNETFTIVSNGAVENVRVTDMNGRVVKSFNNDVTVFNVSDLNEGVYFVQVEQNGNTKTTRLVVR